MPISSTATPINILTVDVEEYFHATEVQRSVAPEQWRVLPSRLRYQMARTLDLLDQHQVKATFFVLGWVAERHPQVVREIAARGHHMGCHSYAHQLVYNLTPDAFRDDTMRAKAAIEDACGQSVSAYRAPSYSITARSTWALETLVDCGFTHDSSIYPVVHDRYGIPGFGRAAQEIQTPAGPILEIPIATARILNCVCPVGGGGYLRLLPYSYTSAGIRRMNSTESMPACIYFHPWEIDPEVPRLGAGRVSRLRTYSGLAGMEAKLSRLMTDFRFDTLESVHPRSALAASTLVRG
jgi:polysaccharide deacetylase family protein (PEP-CTERM system associated)